MSKGKKLDGRGKNPGRFSYLNDLHLGGIERDLNAGKNVEPSVLAEALRRHGSHPIPPVVLDYLCRFLMGKVSKRKGRKPREEAEVRRREILVTGTYYRYLDWLEARRKKYGLPNSWTRGAAAPSEVAARLTARWIFGRNARWHSIRNIIRSRK